MLEAECIDSLKTAWSFPQVEKLVQEIVWRTYWKGWLEQRPSVWTDYLTWLQHRLPTLPENILTEIDAVEQGHSGVAFMDALTHELKTTGYLHNHARMWFAAFWIHTRKLPWQAGADFFYRHLLDADPASNTLSWRWVAGLQTPGKSYLVRQSNLDKYADPDLLTNLAGLDELDDARAMAASLPAEPNPPPQPLPKAFRAPFESGSISGPHALWLHWDDLCPASSELADMPPPAVVLAVWPAALVKSWSPVKTAHFRRALQDGLNRAAAVFGCPGIWLESDHPAAALTDWLGAHDVRHLTAMRPLTGDWSEVVAALEAAGVSASWCCRDWDRRWFPKATKGFFGFWESARPTLAAEWTA